MNLNFKTLLFYQQCRPIKMSLVAKLGLMLMFLCNMSIMALPSIQGQKVSIDVENASLKEVLLLLNKDHDAMIIYEESLVAGVKDITISSADAAMEEVLDICLKGTNLTYKYVNDLIVIKSKSPIATSQEKTVIRGKIVDDLGEPLPGCNILSLEDETGTITQTDGEFVLQVRTMPNTLQVSFIGFENQTIIVTDPEKVLNIKMELSANSLGEVAVVAFGEQKKESMVSSITSVKSEQLKSSSADLTTELAGNIAGLIGWQTGGAPGAMTEEDMNTKFYIRGITSFQGSANTEPLILLDGMEITKVDLARINPDDIESLNVMKDAAATAMYGARGANGVIYVQLKKGKAGNLLATASVETVWNQPTKKLDVVNPIDYMRYYNKAQLSRNPGGTPKYSRDYIERTASGDYPDWVYPANNWSEQLFKDYSVSERYNVNVQGGGPKVQYRGSVSHNVDHGMIKSDKLNQFDIDINAQTTVINTNFTVNMNKNAKLQLVSWNAMDKYHGPKAGVKELYHYSFNTNPVDFAAVYPADEQFDYPHIRFGKKNRSTNPYAELHAGYQDRSRFTSKNKVQYVQKLSSILENLEFRASVDYQKTALFSAVYSTQPAYYSLGSYDHTTGKHTLLPLNELEARRTIELDANSSRSYGESQHGYTVELLHGTSWSDHETSFHTVGYWLEKDNSIPKSYQQSLPQRNMGWSSRATYGYKTKYYFEASFGLNGSERFAKNNRFGFFPAGGVSWIASKENFLRSANWLTFLKFRATYGLAGNDGVIKDPRFVYLQDVGLSGTGNGLGQDLVSDEIYGIKNYGNPNTKWEVAESVNLGMDFKLFKGLIEGTIDAYQETRHNIYDYRRILPGTMGLGQAPLDNVGTGRTRGIDLEGKIQKSFSPDVYLILSGTLSYAKSKYLEVEEATGKPDWQRKAGREISQPIGYVATGLFQSQEEILNSPRQGGDEMPGDIKYKDINHDGVIDQSDMVPIGHPTTPRLTYGFQGHFAYKKWEFGIAFQGLGDRSFFIDPTAISPFDKDRAMLKEIADSHWSPDNQATQPFWPRLSTYNIQSHNPQEMTSRGFRSTYFLQNGKFLRCRKIEVGYYLDNAWVKKAKFSGIKFFARVTNPFIISDFKIWDVELGANGFNYPIQKRFSIGVDIRL